MIAPLFLKITIDTKYMSVIDEAKEILDITADISDIQLLKELRNKVTSVHPDKFQDENVKKEKECEFKRYNDVYHRLKAYIDNQRRSPTTAVTVYSEDDYSQFTYIKELDIKEHEIRQLQNEKKHLEIELSNCKDENSVLKGKLDDLQASSIQTAKEDIQEIYRPKSSFNIVGITALAASIAMVVPQINNIFVNIGMSSNYIQIGLGIIVAIWCFAWLRKYFIKKIVASVESSIVFCPDIESLEKGLGVKTENLLYSTKRYFTESDLSRLIHQKLKKGIRHIVIIYDLNEITQLLTKQIISEFDRKNIIKNTSTSGLNKLFYLN